MESIRNTKEPGHFCPDLGKDRNVLAPQLAEALNKCGFIERSGQGVNLMIEQAVRHTKPLPDFSRSAAHEVFLSLAGTVQNPAFLRFMDKLGEDHISPLHATPRASDACIRPSPYLRSFRCVA